MDPRALVRPLEEAWQPVLDDVLGALRPPIATADVARLGARVAALSAAYNAGAAEGRRTKLPLDARVGFSFPRDVPKGAAAVRELVASGALALRPSAPLRVLDVGAGVGAMTWGVARALAAAGGEGSVEALLVDEDPEVLGAAAALARAVRARGVSAPDVAVTTRVAGVDAIASLARPGSLDVVILGQVLSELDLRADADARAEAHAALIARAGELLTAGGVVVIVEPALRDRTRHLHAVRDRLAAGRGLAIVAPCLHASACPARAVPGEWCHEDLAVDLPPWIAPVARAAGLRWQGLTFSYLVLRRDLGDAPRAAAADPARVRIRAISDLLRTKGKAELVVCGADGQRTRLRRLDRDEAVGVSAFGVLRRGDVVTLASDDGPPVDPRGRVGPNVAVTVDGREGAK